MFYCKTEFNVITFDDLHQHVLELMSDYHFKVGMNGFYDFSSVESLEGDLHKWQVLADGMSDEEIIGSPAKTSIVLQNGNQVVSMIMRDYLEMTANSLIDYKLFSAKEMDLAYSHIKVDSETVLAMLN